MGRTALKKKNELLAKMMTRPQVVAAILLHVAAKQVRTEEVEEVAHLLKSIDSDGDGLISQEEYVAFSFRMKEFDTSKLKPFQRDEALEAATIKEFKFYDLDRSGFVELGEFQSAYRNAKGSRPSEKEERRKRKREERESRREQEREQEKQRRQHEEMQQKFAKEEQEFWRAIDESSLGHAMLALIRYPMGSLLTGSTIYHVMRLLYVGLANMRK